ncbi:MAG TPA: O-antigen ligase family protein [Longimicrobiales bacterium]
MNQALVRVRQEPRSGGLFVLFALWVTFLFDPHWYLAAKGPDIVLKLPVILFLALWAFLSFGMLTNESWQRRWQWFPPFLMLLIIGGIGVPMAMNIGYAKNTWQGYVLWWTLIVGTLAIIDSPRRAEFLLYLYGLQFLWWAGWGGKAGLVGWHHTLSNYDGFGAFNVGGVAICYFLAVAINKRWFKWLMYATAGACAMGVVASFARGAFFALVLVFVIIWLRSPHKGRTALAGVGITLVVVLAASFLFEKGFFWNEIMSVFHEGTTEGTGAQRMTLWATAIDVWRHNPIFGAGLKNYGVYASTLYQEGELGGMFGNPRALYDYVLHNLYLTTLSELGIAGCIALLWIFIDFFRCNAKLRSEAAERRWHELGGSMKLRPIALGLEAAMAAFMVDAAVYSMMGLHWFYTMLALNRLLYAIVVRNNPAISPVPGFRARRTTAVARAARV